MISVCCSPSKSRIVWTWNIIKKNGGRAVQSLKHLTGKAFDLFDGYDTEKSYTVILCEIAFTAFQAVEVQIGVANMVKLQMEF
jgi:hypothetical protein